MKKIIIYILLILVFLIIYFLQSNFFSWFTIYGIMPNLFVIYVLFIGLFAGQIPGAVLGMLFGVLLDIFIGEKIGISGILLGIVGFASSRLDKNFSKDSKLTIMLMCIGATLFYESADYFISVFIYKMDIEIIALIKILLIESIYNSILIIILYPLMQKVGYRIEETFKGSNILTRYF